MEFGSLNLVTNFDYDVREGEEGVMTYLSSGDEISIFKLWGHICPSLLYIFCWEDRFFLSGIQNCWNSEINSTVSFPKWFLRNVKADAMIATEISRPRSRFKWMFELCLVVFLASQSSAWFPPLAQCATELVRCLLLLFSTPLYVFMLFNVVLFVVYSLSVDRKYGEILLEDDFGEDFVKKCESRSLIEAGDESMEAVETPEVSVDEKEIICADNAASPIYDCIDDHTVAAITIAERSLSPIHKNPDHGITKEVSDLKKYRRTQSSRFERQTAEKSQPEFRRSETDVSMRIVGRGGESEKRVRSVEEMNDEEFKNRVEAFIAAQKWIQMEERREEQRGNHTALALCC